MGRLALSFRSLRLAVRLVVLLLFACFRFLTRFVSSPFVFVSSPFVVIIVIIIVVVRVLSLLPLLAFSFSSSVSPHLASLLPRRRSPIAFPSMSHMKRHAHDVPLIYSLGRLPLTSTMGNRWKIELGKTARADRGERKHHVNETLSPDEADDARARQGKRDTQPGRRNGPTNGPIGEKPIRYDGERKAMRLWRERRGGRGWPRHAATGTGTIHATP